MTQPKERLTFETKSDAIKYWLDLSPSLDSTKEINEDFNQWLSEEKPIITSEVNKTNK